jgi:hypothetical protein
MQATRKNKKGQIDEKDSLTDMIASVMSGTTEFIVEQPPEAVDVDTNN